MSGDDLILRIAIYTAYVMGFGGAALIVTVTIWWARGDWRAQELKQLAREREALATAVSEEERVAVLGAIKKKVAWLQFAMCLGCGVAFGIFFAAAFLERFEPVFATIGGGLAGMLVAAVNYLLIANATDWLWGLVAGRE